MIVNYLLTTPSMWQTHAYVPQYARHYVSMYVLCYEIIDRVFGDTKMDEGLE